MMEIVNEFGTAFWFIAWFLTSGLLLFSLLVTRKTLNLNANVLKHNRELLAERGLMNVADTEEGKNGN